MKTVIDKDGNFLFTFEGGEINMDDPAMQGCTIVDGDAPLQTYLEKINEEANKIAEEAAHERDHEHSYLASMETRIAQLESQLSKLQ